MSALTRKQTLSTDLRGKPDITQDAVVIVPGIMGSELLDTTTSRIVWGLSEAGWLIKSWTMPGGMTALQMTEDELTGRSGRIKPLQLLRHSAWTPYFKGFEPYTDLISAVHECTAHPDQVLEFPYDWRMPVAHNARLLAEAARRHLEAWHKHPAHDEARRTRVEAREARLVYVAHSMGGLLTQASLDPLIDRELAGDTRAVITLGTPFYGAVKAASILNSGRGTPVPLPHRRLRKLCATMPGLHDLLPQYICVIDGRDARRLSPADIESLGGNRDLARQASDDANKRAAIPLPGHRAVVGTGQTTAQSLTLKAGVLTTHCHTVRRNSAHDLVRNQSGELALFDVQGDGTVHKESAAVGPMLTHLPLQHGAVAADPFALSAVQELLREDIHLGPPMGGPGCGLEVPDLTQTGQPFDIRINGVHSTAGVRCAITPVDGSTTRQLSISRLQKAADRLTATVVVETPGLYRVTVVTRDRRQVSQLILTANDQ
ncbi:hypothetical protein ACFVHR_24880 [Streptomyces sp. NPDC127168]|uniref:lipase/acyltransferase domain-containing protein n=1 Tax=unclassified Streptomyces TaxID=2593676 RepID=UPI003643CF31